RGRVRIRGLSEHIRKRSRGKRQLRRQRGVAVKCLVSRKNSGMRRAQAGREPPHARLVPARGEQVIGEDEQLSIAQSGGRLQGPVLLAVVDLDAWAKRPRRSVETPVPETELVLVLVDEMHAGAVRDGAQGRPVV